MNEKTFTEVEPFWQVQGSTSFCKAKGDWLKYDKVHLSFVKHEGKPSCKQVLSIEGAVKVHGKDGVLFLSDIILSGAAKKLAEASRAASAGGYAKSFFESKGGTVASRSKNGKCMFREFSVGPGSKSDFVFTMETCEGEENATGGIQPISGAKKDKIFIPLSAGDLFDFARSVQTEYIAHRVMVNAIQYNGSLFNKMPTPTSISPPVQMPTPAPQAASAETKRVCVIIDTSGNFNGGAPAIASVESAITTIQAATRHLLFNAAKKYVATPESYSDAVNFCGKKEKGKVSIDYQSKIDAEAKCAVVISIVDI